MTQTGDSMTASLRIETLDALKGRLGPCETILCLGNGPSSEDPRLAGWPGATLFRVNWIWARRNWFTAPDMVFTADSEILDLPRQPVIVFPNEEANADILRTYADAGHAPRAGFVCLDDFDPPLAMLDGPRIPTNGALMVALAAALRPDRLVIAGIDLYSHPRGKYAGPADNDEGYTSQHSADVDLDVIGRALAAFDGETIILSDNLREALESRDLSDRSGSAAKASIPE